MHGLTYLIAEPSRMEQKASVGGRHDLERSQGYFMKSRTGAGLGCHRLKR